MYKVYKNQNTIVSLVYKFNVRSVITNRCPVRRSYCFSKSKIVVNLFGAKKKEEKKSRNKVGFKNLYFIADTHHESKKTLDTKVQGTFQEW